MFGIETFSKQERGNILDVACAKISNIFSKFAHLMTLLPVALTPFYTSSSGREMDEFKMRNITYGEDCRITRR